MLLSVQGKGRSKMTAADKVLAELDDDARAAVAAVDAAVEKLPQESELSFTVMEEGAAGGGFGEERLPTNPGSKVYRRVQSALLCMVVPDPCIGSLSTQSAFKTCSNLLVTVRPHAYAVSAR